MSAEVYSVAQLNREARNLLAAHFPAVRVAGEISNLSQPASGHLYFTLKDAEAQVRCAMFRGQRGRLRFQPGNGNQVLITAQVTLYEPRGDYQLVVEAMEMAGDGALRLAFERLKQKLQAEGLFATERKRDLPLLPNRIGVITSPSGAAIHDILTVLKRRFPAIPVLIYPVTVQGETAKFEIAAALASANRQQAVDVLIVGRGGGSLEDLWAFNEEIVARAIHASDIPVISAVGHEVDVTIADFVADYRAATPSAAAEAAVPHQSEWLAGFVRREQQLRQQILARLRQAGQHLGWLEKTLQQQHPGRKLQRIAQRLDELELRLAQATDRRLQTRQQQLALASQRLLARQPGLTIAGHHRNLHYLQRRLEQSMLSRLAALRARQAAASQTLNAVSPLATLDRGYAIVSATADGRLIKSVRQLAIGELLTTRLTDGQVLSRITQLPGVADKQDQTTGNDPDSVSG